jgi:cell wall-associated NlpC family hydrolase
MIKLLLGLYAMTLSEYACKFIGKPYKWGGNGPDAFDCSGYISEVLRSKGIIDERDYSSQMLYNKLINHHHTSGLGAEAILFFGKNTQEIIHVALALNHDQLVEAAGEGRVDTDNGSVRVRKIHYRKDLVAAIKLTNI